MTQILYGVRSLSTQRAPRGFILAQMTQILYEVRSLATQRAQRGFILAQMTQIVFGGDVPMQRLYELKLEI